ncbi:GNAT family N-acetyltransferase [Rhizobium gallicum]|uniref:GNAT family N-acetyltransferase n=1 Tax=Rhizobium gallicum TaxID=56730 RepID=UPI001EF75A15|nr:GNAT family N-acetyltransferase [Rhizobium gallicum]ULJ72633.1 GNAT family N-acetyltransferase [Rhizobium gallicum]
MQKLHLRSDYAHTKGGLRELGSLILDVFEVDISSLDRLGHDPSVVAFGWWQDEHLIANVSLYERKLWLSGQQVIAFGVQSVATRPEWRNRGLFSDLMGRALDYADHRSDLVILATGTPDLYRRFGFRQIEEMRFSSKLMRRGSPSACRELSLESDRDLALLNHAFVNRVPTSLLASACDHPALFMLKAKLTPEIKLLHLPELDAIVAVKQDTSSLSILDIVASTIPPVDEIVSAIDFNGQQVQVHLTPDRLSWKPDESHPIDNGYMVRGPFAPEGQAFMLSDMRI